MIGYLQGEILDHADGKMLVIVGDKSSGGTVGYSVAVPQSASYGAHLPGQQIELFVHTHVREDALDLYGFSSKYEKVLFLTLLGVNGIGPKSALGILSAVESSQLVDAIIQGDQAYLTRIPGIGKKTAERVVVELRDTVRKKVDAGIFIQSSKTKSSGKSSASGARISGTDGSSDLAIFEDAKAALLSLGYREQEVNHLLTRVIDTSEVPLRRAEDLIKTALRQLG